MIMRLIAPGPAVTGIARGTIATEPRSEASSISSLVCLVRLVRAWSIRRSSTVTAPGKSWRPIAAGCRKP